MAVLETRDISMELGGQVILDHISVQAGRGQVVGLIGPNGSGKSTLLKCIYRVLRPTGGAVLLDGKDLKTYTVRQSARQLAVVAQHTS